MSLEEQMQKQQILLESGRTSSEEISLLQEQLLRSKLQLSERRQQLRNEVGEDIRELNRQCREAMIRLDELETEKSVLYGHSPGSISDSMKYEMLEAQIEAAKENLRRALIERSESTLQIDLLQPPVISYDKIEYPDPPVKGD